MHLIIMTLKASSAVAANVANKQRWNVLTLNDCCPCVCKVKVKEVWEVLEVKRIQVYIMNLSVDLGHQVAAKYFGS